MIISAKAARRRISRRLKTARSGTSPSITMLVHFLASVFQICLKSCYWFKTKINGFYRLWVSDETELQIRVVQHETEARRRRFRRSRHCFLCESSSFIQIYSNKPEIYIYRFFMSYNFGADVLGMYGRRSRGDQG